MKQAMINYMQQEKNDELYTPTEAILPILKYLDHNKIYWECTDLSETGYPTEDISQAQQYTNLTVAKQEIENLDDEYKECAVIYKVTEIREYKVEKEGK